MKSQHIPKQKSLDGKEYGIYFEEKGRIKQIYDSNVRTKAVMTPIGYKELFDYFDGNKSLEECIDLIKQRSRRYAKRQYTWFNNQMNVNWFEVDFTSFNKTIYEIEEYIKRC